MDIEKDIKTVFGVGANDIALSLLNISTNASFEKENAIEIAMKDQINMALRLYPTLIKTFNDRKDKDDLETARDEVFTPILFSPDSHVKLSHPKPWQGDFRTEAKMKELSIYSTDQIFPKYSNGILGSLLASKYKYNSNRNKNRNLLVSVDNVSASDTKYVLSRGACSGIGADSDDSVRYICQYKFKNKSGFSLISGCSMFISGIDEILTNIVEGISSLKSDNEHFRGIVFPKTVNMFYSAPIDKEAQALTKEHIATMVGRLMIGSIMVHDHLWVLKNIFGVEKIFELDDAGPKAIKKIAIDDVIKQFSLAKKHVMTIMGLGLVK